MLGAGLLERARSTTLALLGATTAVGLVMVALALNQSWPLVADSPLPAAPPRHEAIGKATVVARAIANGPGSGLVRLDGAEGPDSRRAASGGDAGGAHVPEGGFAPSASAELVVAPSAPAEPQGDAPGSTDDPAPAPSPAGKTPQVPATPEPAQPQPAPQSPPVVESTPPATSSEAPVDSSVPPWSNGKGHAYGRDKSASDYHGHSAGDCDDDWDDDRDDDAHGHHWSGGRHDD